MRVAKSEMYEWGVSAVHVERDGEAPWTFVPLEADTVQAVEPLGNTHLLAIGSRAAAIWRLHDRHRTSFARFGSAAYLAPRCYASERGSMFFTNHAAPLREVPIDGSPERQWPIADAHLLACGAVEGGRELALTARVGEQPRLRTPHLLRLDLASGRTLALPLPGGMKLDYSHQQTIPSAFSPDGRLVARVHLGSVAFAPASRGNPLFAFARPSFAGHPDLATLRGQDAFGIAVELYDTATGRLAKRLLAGFMGAAEYDALILKSGWGERSQLNTPGYAVRKAAEEGVTLTAEGLARTWLKPGRPLFRSIIERMAEGFPYDRWDGDRQILYNDTDGPASTRGEREFIDFPFGFLTSVELAWRDDGQALLVTFRDGKRREVALDGTVAILPDQPPQIDRSVPEPALKAVRAAFRERATNTVSLAGLDADSCRAALADMAARMAAGLPALLFNDVLDWRFQLGRKRLDERGFFRHLRTLAPAEQASLLLPLRALLHGYGEQARTVRPVAHEALLSGVGSDREEQWQAALADAALYLAQTDPHAGPHLRDWLLAVDQEHDQVAAGKVVPAFAKTSRFADEPALRFGLFYLLDQWQAPAVPFAKLGLAAAARAWCAPDRFVALVAEERATAAAARRPGDPPPSLVNVRAVLGNAPWDRAVAALLPPDA